MIKEDNIFNKGWQIIKEMRWRESRKLRKIRIRKYFKIIIR